MSKPYDQTCPIARTLDIIGDRWTLLIVRDLFMGKTRFNQFLASSPGLPSKLLSDRLKKLEQHDLVERVVYSQHPLRAEYRLTDQGRTLAPVIEEIVRWGLDHCFEGEPEARVAVIERISSGLPAYGRR
ncbi:MAG: helix-turn-helix transcriptional regulator [Chloroflexi bacterium]|nr:helix-turn-helix transcriptional regulator [Chloroflexota bacterium]